MVYNRSDISYVSEPPVSVLGCISHTEVCNPVTNPAGNCLLFPALYDGGLSKDEIVEQLSLSAAQSSVLGRLYNNIRIAEDMNFMLLALSGQGLLAFESLDGGWGTSLPENQWILELQNLFSILLTYFQISATEYVTGLQTASFNRFIQAPTSSDQW